MKNETDLSKYDELIGYDSKLQEVWEGREVEDLKTWKEHLEDFDESYRTSKNFKDTGRATVQIRRTQQIEQDKRPVRARRTLSEYDLNPRGVGNSEVTTWEEHLEDFTISYQTDGDFKKARGKRNSGRYEMLNKC